MLPVWPVLVEDLAGYAPAHEVAVGAATSVVAVQPHVSLCLKLTDAGEPSTVERRPPALLEGGSPESFADGVVVRAPGRDGSELVELADTLEVLGHHEAPLGEAVRNLSATERWLGHRDRQQLKEHMRRHGVWELLPRPSLGYQRLEPIALGHGTPLVEGLAGDPEHPARLGHVAASRGMFQHAHASLIDDVVMRHGDGLLVVFGTNTKSITGPTLRVDLQPQLAGRN